MVWLHPTYGRVPSVVAESGRSRQTYDSLAARRPWRAALASSPRRGVVFSSQHASASSSTPPTALQQRLAEAGLADWQAFCQPRYSTLASQSEVGSVAAKIVELCKEGLAAGDIERLFQQHRNPWTSDLQQVFLPNMAYLRELLAGERIVTTPYEPPGLTPLGRLLRNQPASMGTVLNRSPSLLVELEAWLCGELGLSRKQLAHCTQKQPSILFASVGTSTSVLTFLTQELGVSVEQAVELLPRYPSLYRSSPDTLARKCSELTQLLNVQSVTSLVVREPRLLLVEASRLPVILRALDALMSQEGAGVELIIRSPMVAAIAPPKVEKAVQQLMNLGLDTVGIRELVSVHPDLLMKDLEGPVQQQKLQWAQEQLGWPLDKVLRGGLFNLSLRRMASRLAFRRQLGLPDPGSLRYIGKDREPVFLAQVSKATGREVSTADFAEWVAAWLQTPEGQRWGFKPEKPKRVRQPKGDTKV